MGTALAVNVRPGTLGREGAIRPRPHTSHLAALLGRRVGRSDKSAQHDLDRVKDTLAHLVAIIGDDPSVVGQVEALVAPVVNAMSVGRVPHLDAALIYADHCADLAEDAARAAYIANPTRETLTAFRTAKSRAQGTSKTVLVALGEELSK